MFIASLLYVVWMYLGVGIINVKKALVILVPQHYQKIQNNPLKHSV